ncbi:MAG: hypothetical protein VB140_08555 [Burkholderia sp.]
MGQTSLVRNPFVSPEIIDLQFDVIAFSRRCCINRARAVDVYAQRARGQPPIQSDSRVTA